MTLSLGAEGVLYLEPHEWQGFVSYRWLHADEGYVGTHVDPTYKSVVGARIDLHSFDVNATYALTKRFSLSLTMPFTHGEVSSFREHENDGTHRHTMSAGGLGDIRLTANAWLFDPNKYT